MNETFDQHIRRVLKYKDLLEVQEALAEELGKDYHRDTLAYFMWVDSVRGSLEKASPDAIPDALIMDAYVSIERIFYNTRKPEQAVRDIPYHRKRVQAAVVDLFCKAQPEQTTSTP